MYLRSNMLFFNFQGAKIQKKLHMSKYFCNFAHKFSHYVSETEKQGMESAQKREHPASWPMAIGKAGMC